MLRTMESGFNALTRTLINEIDSRVRDQNEERRYDM